MAEQDINSIGFIMDGNRRWAKGQNVPTLEGHRQGAVVFSDTVRWAKEKGIPHVAFYAFSTENWNRQSEEVSYLLDLFREWFKKLQQDHKDRAINIRFVGQREDFPEDIQRDIAEIEIESQVESPVTTVWIALSYGGRAEIMAAVNQMMMVADKKTVTEREFGECLWTHDMPDLDLIVRTGGEYRLSNFMTWKSVYSELIFIKKMWPELTDTDRDALLEKYCARQRRFGK